MDLDKDPAFTYGKLLLLADDRTVSQEMEDDIVPEDVTPVPENNNSNKALSYKAYGLGNIKQFIHLMQKKGSSAAKHNDGTVIPVGCMKRSSNNNGTPKTNNARPTQKHTQFLINLVDQNLCITATMAREQLCNMFQGLSISESGLRKLMKKKIRPSLKNSSIYTMERAIELCYKIITNGKRLELIFKRIRRMYFSFGTINFSKIEPLKPNDVAKIEKEFPLSENKKRKAKTDESFKTKVKKGTIAYHIITFIRNVMDNYIIYHSRYVIEAIQSRGYRPLFLSPYSPFLNPIEGRWSKIKEGIHSPHWIF
ncbi:uncharacterized protein RHIMIDRAFT_299847 [Rhizopus microsporus ATCC 52813]|uniref:Tc1-like transposase DDE domain-containing protein n=1 Tax=Rhizopus microsporus ATCC 52813 TaxID=1340429 RepID=A0A2G4SKY9_RHIZD|nr:uncharacterized protein RHIMIDRAFT_299847 [Rhizopus microsporus ATCC 52813]PHZ09424.1 hypothetical protein RHIMIDRAFT_299847 [Rhizopus microsporus ATCC 52813]